MAMKMVAIAVALTLGGCHRNPPTVWPKSAGNVVVADWKDDGGQSLAPQTSIATDIEASDHGNTSASSSTAAATTASAADKPTTSDTGPAAVPAPKGEVIFSDEIIIDLTNP